VPGSAPHHTRTLRRGGVVRRNVLATVATLLPRGTIGLQVGLEEKQRRSYRDSNPGHPARSSVTTLTELHHSSLTIKWAVEHGDITAAVGCCHTSHVTTHKSHTLLYLHARSTQNVCDDKHRFIKYEAATGQTHYRRQFAGNGTTVIRNVWSHSTNDRRKVTSCCAAKRHRSLCRRYCFNVHGVTCRMTVSTHLCTP